MANGNRLGSASIDRRVVPLARAFDAVGVLIANVDAGQWTAPTPCTDWDVRRLVDHLIGMNRVFTALLVGAAPPPKPPADHAEPNPGSLGSATGEDRLRIRLYDLLAHGWDLAQATGQPADLPEDLAEQSLTFVRTQLSDSTRVGRFAPATEVSRDAPAIDRLVAFLGRPITAGRQSAR